MDIQTLPSVNVCDGSTLKRLVAAALAYFERHYKTVNKLNVFPVPDGDTGTNMLLTLRAAYREIAEDDSPGVHVIAHKLAQGAFYGSRGNSGTALSQLLRGFADVLRGVEALDSQHLVEGAGEAVRAAYKAFQAPVEGTILTVAREISEGIRKMSRRTRDLRLILKHAVERGQEAVARTPDLLPVLKKAGVVDSGGQGLLFMLEGALRHASGLPIAESSGVSDDALLSEVSAAELDEAYALSSEYGEGGFGYDVQYVIRGQALDAQAIRDAIEGMGNSAIVVEQPGMVKVHVHVHNPEAPLAYGRRWGELDEIVIENMQEQAKHYRAERTREAEIRWRNPHLSLDEGQIAVVAVSPGEGLTQVFFDQRTAAVVHGGQTMNPSVSEFMQVIRSLHARQIILLPNNDNVILTARQAASLAAEEQKAVVVIPTRTIPQGITAILGYATEGDLDEVARAMEEAAAGVVTGEVTIATRATEIDGVRVAGGQYIGLVDGRLALAGDTLGETVRDLLRHMDASGREIITIYYGDQVSEAEAQRLSETLSADYPAQTVQVIEGGQPFYPYLIGVE